MSLGVLSKCHFMCVAWHHACRHMPRAGPYLCMQWRAKKVCRLVSFTRPYKNPYTKLKQQLCLLVVLHHLRALVTVTTLHRNRGRMPIMSVNLQHIQMPIKHNCTAEDTHIHVSGQALSQNKSLHAAAPDSRYAATPSTRITEGMAAFVWNRGVPSRRAQPRRATVKLPAHTRSLLS